MWWGKDERKEDDGVYYICVSVVHFIFITVSWALCTRHCSQCCDLHPMGRHSFYPHLIAEAQRD